MDFGLRARIEAGVNRAVGIEPADVKQRRRARATAEPDEVTAYHDLPIRLKRQRVDVECASGVERAVERSVRIDPPDVVARPRPGAAAQSGEVTADHDFPIRL